MTGPIPGIDQIIRVAAAIVIDRQGRLLLVRKTGTRAFMQPGGKIAQGETAAECLVRELHEELGVHATVDTLEQISVILKRLNGFPRLPARRGFRRGLVDHKGAATLSGGRGKPAFGGPFKPISCVAKFVRCPTSHGTSRLGEWA